MVTYVLQRKKLRLGGDPGVWLLHLHTLPVPLLSLFGAGPSLFPGSQQQGKWASAGTRFLFGRHIGGGGRGCIWLGEGALVSRCPGQAPGWPATGSRGCGLVHNSCSWPGRTPLSIPDGAVAGAGSAGSEFMPAH